MAMGKKTGGRQKGTPNRLTTEIKTAIINAFAQVGGENYLVTVAKDNPAVFCNLLGKVLPLTVTGDSNAPLSIHISDKAGKW